MRRAAASQDGHCREVVLAVPIPSAFVEAIIEMATPLLRERLARGDRDSSPWLTVTEAARYLGWPKGRLYKLTAAQAVPHRKHGSRIMFQRQELDRWLDEYREGPAD
jgi:excisionase family DNA binding protein